MKYHIATGRLEPDDELPSVRAVAGEHLINPNTVARAYRELEHEGVIYKRRGMGTYVADKGVQISQQERRRVVRQLLNRALVQGVQLGMNAEEIRALFDESLDEFKPDD